MIKYHGQRQLQEELISVVVWFQRQKRCGRGSMAPRHREIASLTPDRKQSRVTEMEGGYGPSRPAPSDALPATRVNHFEQHHRVRAKCSNPWACRGHFHSDHSTPTLKKKLIKWSQLRSMQIFQGEWGNTTHKSLLPSARVFCLTTVKKPLTTQFFSTIHLSGQEVTHKFLEPSWQQGCPWPTCFMVASGFLPIERWQKASTAWWASCVRLGHSLCSHKGDSHMPCRHKSWAQSSKFFQDISRTLCHEIKKKLNLVLKWSRVILVAS